MNSVYKKTEISKVKLGKIKRDIIDNKYVNTETGEILDILYTKKSKVYLRTNYIKFDIINKDIMNLYKKIGATSYGHLLMLIQNMKSDNSIDYSILGLSTQGLKTVKKKYKEFDIIQKGKLSDDKSVKYYLNPDISTYGNKYSKELTLLFNN